MHPTRLTFENIGPFRGKHTIDLSDGVYSIVAQHEDNPERSNWVGKSSFLWLVPYALFGQHTAKADDGWITDGESELSMTMLLSDGSVIERLKKRGKPTQIEFRGSGLVVRQKAAQEAIDNHIGMSRDDYLATCFYEQKMLSRLVSARSAERIAIVEAWLAEDLEPIQNMHAEATLDLSNVSKEIAKLEAFVDHIEENELDRDFGSDGELAIAEAEYKSAEDAHQKAVDARKDAELWASKLEMADEFDNLVAQGQKLKVEYDRIPDNVSTLVEQAAKEKEKAAIVKQKADDEFKRLEVLNTGTFDGTCPVNKKPCPSASWVTSEGVSPAELGVAGKSRKEAHDEWHRWNANLHNLSHDEKVKVSLKGRLAELRAQANTLVEVANEVEETDGPDIDALDASIVAAKDKMLEAKKNLDEVRADIAVMKKAQKDKADALAKLKGLKEKRALHVEAVQFLGKTGVQQKLGEIALSQIEVGANDLLHSANIELSVRVEWVTHLQGLAKHCHVCGTAFPSSARVKECSSCKTARGKNAAAKLVIELSNRSGAAEDLAGMAVGLAASQWLRAKRFSAWSCVSIDEPFGALDPHNRRALSVHVASMLTRSFDSAFVVAHDKAILDALPKRVSLVGGKHGTRLEAPQ